MWNDPHKSCRIYLKTYKKYKTMNNSRIPVFAFSSYII